VLSAYLERLLQAGRTEDAIATYETWSHYGLVPPLATTSISDAGILPATPKARLAYAKALLKNRQLQGASLEFAVLSGLGVMPDAQVSGELRAQYNLGDLYLRGEGVPHDESTAFAWFHKAALGGHAEARIMLGSMYAAGRGTPADSAAAYMWLSLAVLQGDSRANAQLDVLRSQMTREQIMEATGRARSLAQTPLRQLRQSLFH